MHPYFEPVYRTRGTPAMVIKRPLEARHFLRDGVKVAVAFHTAREAAIVDRAIAALRLV
jgi:hypothetical protein